MSKQPISRVLFPSEITLWRENDHSSSLDVTIEIKQPTRELERTTLSVPLFGLAPGGVYLAPTVTGRTGELLPHPFILTPSKISDVAVYFLWHFPSRHRDWVLPSTLSDGARTFLSLEQQGSDHLFYFNIPVLDT